MWSRALTPLLVVLLVVGCSRAREREPDAALPVASAPTIDAASPPPWTELRLTLWAWDVRHTIVVRPDGVARHVPPGADRPDATSRGSEREEQLSAADRATVECAIATLARGGQRHWEASHSSDSGFVAELVANGTIAPPTCDAASAVGELDRITFELRNRYRASIARDR